MPSRSGSFWLLGCLALGVASCSDHTYSAAQATADRRACKFAKGALAKDTLAADAPVGDKIPIDHIVVILQENRSFDSYFSGLTHGGVDVGTLKETNPDVDGTPVARFHQTALCFDDTAHSWSSAHAEYNNGALDGFVKKNSEDGEDGRRAMGYYTEQELPFYYSLARAFAISDRHFCSAMTSTWTNRMYFWAATSWGLISNDFPPATDPEGELYPNIFLQLSDANVSWKVYAARRPTPAILIDTFSRSTDHFRSLEEFATDAAAGTLPSFAMVEPDTSLVGISGDEHPPADLEVGQAFTAGVVKSLMSSPQWAHTAMFLTYDEHGGLYDHVQPPESCPPDDLRPSPLPTEDPKVYDRYGFRVPLLVVSPYAKRGYVSHNITDHTSITRFVEARFNLPAMTARDANADPLFDLFDFSHPDLSAPTLEEATVDETKKAACLAAHPGMSN
jgi:phospholipase C